MWTNQQIIIINILKLYLLGACLSCSVWLFWCLLQTLLLSRYFWEREEDLTKKSCCTGLKELCRFCHSLTNGNGAPGCRECRPQKSATGMESWSKHKQQQCEQGCPFIYLFIFLFVILAVLCLFLLTQRSRYLVRHLATLCLPQALGTFAFRIIIHTCKCTIWQKSHHLCRQTVQQVPHSQLCSGICYCVYVLFISLWIIICKVVDWIWLSWLVWRFGAAG